jgi:hypothetical protein
MTETTIPREPPRQKSPDIAVRPFDLLMNLIVAFLAPMFVTVSGGDIQLARMAAIETVNAYRARDHADLIAIAQVIGCGLTALGSLGLSMADDLSLSMTLRLRGNAVALNRAAEQNRRTLTGTRPGDAAPHQAPFTPGVARYEARVRIPVNTQAPLQAQTEIPVGAAPTVATPVFPPVANSAVLPVFAAVAASAITVRQQQAMLAFAMTEVAEEFTAGLKNLPPAQHQLASRRAAALSSCANQLLLGNVVPPLRPAELAAILPMQTAR